MFHVARWSLVSEGNGKSAAIPADFEMPTVAAIPAVVGVPPPAAPVAVVVPPPADPLPYDAEAYCAAIEARLEVMRAKLRPTLLTREERTTNRRRAWKRSAAAWRARAIGLADLVEAVADDVGCDAGEALYGKCAPGTCLACSLYDAAEAARRGPR